MASKTGLILDSAPGYLGFFAAYNVDPARFEDYLLRSVRLPEEMQYYLLSIGPDVREAVLAERPDIAAEAAQHSSYHHILLGKWLVLSPRNRICD